MLRLRMEGVLKIGFALIVYEFKDYHFLNLAQKPENFERVCVDFAPYRFRCVREIGVVLEYPHASCTKAQSCFLWAEF
jgi:hypothetical protein